MIPGYGIRLASKCQVMVPNRQKNHFFKVGALIKASYAAFWIVGVTGFEPATSWSRTRRSTKLSHTP